MIVLFAVLLFGGLFLTPAMLMVELRDELRSTETLVLFMVGCAFLTAAVTIAVTGAV